MPRPTARFFLGNQLIASGPAPDVDDRCWPWISTAYLCPKCGDIWARVVVEGTRWTSTTAACPRPGHEPGAEYTGHDAGSFFGVYKHYLLDCPRDLLLYEFNIRLKAANLEPLP